MGNKVFINKQIMKPFNHLHFHQTNTFISNLNGKTSLDCWYLGKKCR